MISTSLDTSTLRRAGALALLLGLLAAAAPSDSEAGPRRCAGKRATIVRGGGDDVIRAPRHGPQVIVAGGGDDRIFGFGHRDRICAGGGEDLVVAGIGRDRVFGGSGDDFIDLGPGRDRARAGAGADTVVGGGGSERVKAGPGNDRIFGGIHDDRLRGDGGDDLVAGGQGMDSILGGGGYDWIRGDTNEDRYRGGAGADTLSFATATPPGPRPGVEGVQVNLRSGRSRGDDSVERISGIENVVGSPFRDSLAGRGGGRVDGGSGPDACRGFASMRCNRRATSGPVAMIVQGGSPDPGLLVLGASGGDAWTISEAGSVYRISGSTLRAGSGCDSSAGAVVCAAPRALGWVLAWGGGGGDRITAADLPSALLIKFDGGLGGDVLEGGQSGDVLHAGEGGSDLLLGDGGDDALVARPGGGDRLFGGGGVDQLVTDSPCAGHRMSGGAGRADVAGFGHVQAHGVKARIGGGARLRRGGKCDPTRILKDNEVLEGSRFRDVLIAGRGNLLIGRAGNDRCIGGRQRRC